MEMRLEKLGALGEARHPGSGRAVVVSERADALNECSSRAGAERLGEAADAEGRAVHTGHREQ